MSKREFNKIQIVAEKIEGSINDCISEHNLSLAEMIGILETLKLELFDREKVSKLNI